MSWNSLKAFNIDIYKLSNKSHEYQFDWDDQLFRIAENSLVQKGQGECNIVLDKSETMITLDFEIKGVVELTCDRSLENFDHEINLQEHLILKLGDDNIEMDNDLVMIHRDTQQINIGEYLYEYISLAIPMKRLHPDLEDEEEGVVYYTETAPDQEETKEDDPRWAALKKLK